MKLYFDNKTIKIYYLSSIKFLHKREVKYFSAIYLLCKKRSAQLSLNSLFCDIFIGICHVDFKSIQYQFLKTQEAVSKIAAPGHCPIKFKCHIQTPNTNQTLY